MYDFVNEDLGVGPISLEKTSMPKTCGTCIITAVDAKYEQNLLEDFLPSLRETAGYGGNIVVVDYGLTEAARRGCRTYGVEITKKERSKYKDICVQRFVDILEVIDSLDSSIAQVMTIDGGDVWFQAPFDEVWWLTANGIGFVREIFIAEQCAMWDWINMMPTSIAVEYRSLLKGQIVVNAGMIVGQRDVLRQFISALRSETERIGVDAFGPDQAALNFLALREQNRYHIIDLDEKYNYMLNSKIYELTLNAGKICNSHGEEVPIVHNAGNRARVVQGMRAGKTDHELHAIIFAQKTQRYFERGYEYFENNEMWKARKDFLISIRIHPLYSLQCYVYLFFSSMPVGMVQWIRYLKHRFIKVAG